ncbi:uncharacterized protein TRAVEDRAFT_25018 [Trametes versicolor FP-101664 SS1]|uniref:Uncharacterized protein n=1 Tax=Trametes versicolor (strain FP-101664) TaxID=717944 RepID=R7S6E7_TRAVS|nr:uncharacterized protein TRAVEDRAFT_25018 [Trametes versicolor FP-101664 SS1]EIW51518.1 hypothetical protein TRAVEDRAFT_25018 [Trametes versicolor FP-101664 SS1]
MSTYSNYTYARMSLNIVVAHSRIEVEDEYTRLVKRLKLSDDGLQTIRKCLANLSRNAVGKKRLRKKFTKSLRNASPRSDHTGGPHFAFTFTLASLARPSEAVPVAMEDIEVLMPSIDLIYGGHNDLVVVSQQDQVPMHIDSQSEVNCAGSRTSASISTVDMETEEMQGVSHTPDVPADSPRDAEQADDAPQVVTSVNMDISIPRFLLQGTALKVRRSPPGAVRGLGKARQRRVAATVIPYRKTSRPQWYATASRLGGSLTVPEQFASTSMEGAPASPGRISSAKSFLRLVKPFISLDDDDDDITTSTVEDVVPDVLVETKEGSPIQVEEVGCRFESTIPIGEIHGALCFSTPVESDEHSEDDGEAPFSDSDVAGLLASDEEPQADVELIENVAEASELCDCGSPVPVPVEEIGQDVFGSVLRLLAPITDRIAQDTTFEEFDTSNEEDGSAEDSLDDEVIHHSKEDSLFNLASIRASSSLCCMENANSSAYDADISDEFSLYPVSDDEEDSLVAFFELRECQASVVVHREEIGELESAATDSCSGRLVSHLDECFCEESSLHASASHLTALSSCTSEIWYDALDYPCDGLRTPAFSLGDIQSAWDAVLPGYAQSSLSATGTWIDLNSSTSLPGTMPGAFNVSGLSDSPLESLYDWTSAVPISVLLSVGSPHLTSDFLWGSLGDLAPAELPAASSEPFVSALDDPLEALRRDMLSLLCDDSPSPSDTACSFQLPEDDFPLWVLNNAPSEDLADHEVSSMVPTSVPALSRTFPGAWEEGFESVDDL